MNKAERGKLIISLAKSLKSFQLADPTLAALLYASHLAGRAGLVASALRHNERVSLDRITALAANEGFGLPDLKTTVLPWLERSGLVRVRKVGGRMNDIECLVVSYSGLLGTVSDLYDSLEPQAEDVGCLHILAFASDLPRAEPELLHLVSKEVGEEKARAALRLAKNYNLVSWKEGVGLREPIIYSERVWAKGITRAADALSGLDLAKRTIVQDFVEQVRRYQGMPEALLSEQAAKTNASPLLALTIGVGLLNRTEIQMANGDKRTFLTSPHFFADLDEEFGEDMCDRVKIFLDSTRNGQHFGHPWTGRIVDPDALLRKLINNGVIGPCTAIGTDWVTSERAGIVKVRRDDVRSGKCYLELLQSDVVSKVHSLISTGSLGGVERPMDSRHVREGSQFRSIEQLRPEAGKVPVSVAEAERAIILKLRES